MKRPQGQELSTTPLSIALVAVGARGSKILQRIEGITSENIKRIAVVHDVLGTDGIVADTVILLPNDPKAEGASVEQQEEIASSLMMMKGKEIIEALEGSDLVFFVGNITKNLVAHEIRMMAAHARLKGAVTAYVAARPFLFEGLQQQDAASRTEAILHGRLDAFIPIDSNHFNVKGMSVAEAATSVERFIAKFIESLIAIVQQHGSINVDWNDIRSTITNAGQLYFNSVTNPRGDVNALVEKLFSKGTNETLERAVYVISSGSDLPMAEVSDIGKGIGSRLGQDARIIFGMTNKEALGEEVEVTLFAAGR